MEKVGTLVASRYAGHNFSLENYQNAVAALGKLTQDEAKLNSALLAAAKTASGSGIYIIAHTRTDIKTLQHEKWHATYHFDDGYRKRVSGIWESVKRSNPSWAKQFEKHLSDKYAQHVWVDEFQAIVLNREYECATKTVNLLQSIIPKKEPFRTVTVKIK